MLNITLNFEYTQDARLLSAIVAETEPRTWQGPSDISLMPMQGEAIAFGKEPDAPRFVVKHRLFIWRSQDDLVIEYTLAPHPDQRMSRRT